MKTEIKDVFQLAAESVYGEEATNPNYVSFNFINDGSVEVSEGIKTEKGVGGIVAYHSFVEASINIGGLLSDGDLTLLNSHFPSSDLAPKSFTVKAGNSDLGFGVKAYGCIPSEIGLEGKVGEALKYAIKYEVMDVDLLTNIPTPVTPNRTGILVWHQGIVVINGNSYQVSEFKLSFKQPIHLSADFSPKPSGKKRVRHLVGWGYPEIEFSAKIYLPFPTDLAADAPNVVDVSIVVGNVTYSLNDLWIEKRSFPIKGGDDIWVMDISLKGHEASLSIS